MKLIASSLILTCLQGCIPLPPMGITGAARAAWMETYQLIMSNPTGDIPDSSIDVFYSWVEMMPSSFRIFHGIRWTSPAQRGRFYMAYSGFPMEDANETFENLIPRLWINRPSWYFPTRTEVENVRECVVRALYSIEERRSELTEGDQLVAEVMGQIGQAVFSHRTSRIMSSVETPIVEINDDVSMVFEEYMKSPVVVQLLEETPAAAPIGDVEWLVGQLGSLEEDGTVSDSALIHASDYLDHFGHQAASLPVWKSLFSNMSHETFQRLARLISVKPDVVENSRDIQGMRFTNFHRGMGRAWSSWRQYNGSLIAHVYEHASLAGRGFIQNCVAPEWNVQVSSELRRELFDALEFNRGAMTRFSRCFVGQIANGDVAIPEGEYKPYFVAVFLHLVKASSDPLAIIAS